MKSPEETRAFGKVVDFGKTALDYGNYRAGFPPEFFERIADSYDLSTGQSALDIGTGTGTIARGLAQLGLVVTGLDPSGPLLEQAARLDREAGQSVAYCKASAESLPFLDGSFDVVTAGQCWHWFDRRQVANETFRVLRQQGRIVIAHFDWLPVNGNVVEQTEALILEANPDWTMSGGTGIYPQWMSDLAEAGLSNLETQSFDISVPYSHDAWCGRIRASAAIAASLDHPAAHAFEIALRNLLKKSFPESPLAVPHRIWWATGQRC